MTQEQKARAYDEALEKARKLYNDAKANEYKSDMEDYEFIFPELAESEDERITDTIFNCLYQCCDTGFISGKQRDNALSWLEKQKDKMTAEEYEKSELFQLKLKTRYANGYQDGLAQKEQKGETLRDFIDDFPYSDEQKEQKPGEIPPYVTGIK